MKQIKPSSTENKTGIYMKPLVSKAHLLLLVVMLLAASCSKTLKAGNPIALTYTQVYMIGNATPAAWDINKAIAMVQTPGNTNEFTWSGPLVTGEIKFPTAKSFNSDTFMASVSGQPITNSKAMLAINGNPDWHWVLTSADAGNYKITVNTKDQTITFQKQ